MADNAGDLRLPNTGLERMRGVLQREAAALVARSRTITPIEPQLVREGDDWFLDNPVPDPTRSTPSQEAKDG